MSSGAWQWLPEQPRASERSLPRTSQPGQTVCGWLGEGWGRLEKPSKHGFTEAPLGHTHSPPSLVPCPTAWLECSGLGKSAYLKNTMVSQRYRRRVLRLNIFLGGSLCFVGPRVRGGRRRNAPSWCFEEKSQPQLCRHRNQQNTPTKKHPNKPHKGPEPPPGRQGARCQGSPLIRLQHLGERPREEALSAPRTAAPSPTRGARGGASGVGSAWAQTPPFSWAEPCSSVQESRSSKIHPKNPRRPVLSYAEGTARPSARAASSRTPATWRRGDPAPQARAPACVPCRAVPRRRGPAIPPLPSPRPDKLWSLQGRRPLASGAQSWGAHRASWGFGGLHGEPGLAGAPPGHPPQPAPARTFLLLHQFNKLAGFFGGAKGRGAENAG